MRPLGTLPYLGSFGIHDSTVAESPTLTRLLSKPFLIRALGPAISIRWVDDCSVSVPDDQRDPRMRIPPLNAGDGPLDRYESALVCKFPSSDGQESAMPSGKGQA